MFVPVASTKAAAHRGHLVLASNVRRPEVQPVVSRGQVTFTYLLLRNRHTSKILYYIQRKIFSESVVLCHNAPDWSERQGRVQKTWHGNHGDARGAKRLALARTGRGRPAGHRYAIASSSTALGPLV